MKMGKHTHTVVTKQIQHVVCVCKFTLLKYDGIENMAVLLFLMYFLTVFFNKCYQATAIGVKDCESNCDIFV